MGKDTKERIIEAAEEMIAEVGFARTTMRGIAEKADLSTGGLYHHYRSKEDIIYDVMDRSLSESTRIVESFHKGNLNKNEISADIKNNIVKRFHKMDQNRMQFYLIQEALLGNKDIEAKFQVKYSEWISRTEELIEYLYEEHETSKYKKSVSALLIGAIDGVVLQLLLATDTVEIENIATVFDHFLKKGIPDILNALAEKN